MTLIKQEDAVKAIRKCKFESVMPSDWYIGMECAQGIISALPSAEADCKWNREETPDADDFCSCGERREDGET